MIESAIDILVFDSYVGKMQLVIEIRQVVRPRPVFDLLVRAIRTSIAIGAVGVALVQPTLVLALEFVIEDHPIDAGLPRLELFCFAQVGLVDLRVMFDLARLHEAGVELLPVLLIPIDAMCVEQVSPPVGENDNVVPVTIQPLRAHESLLAEVSQIAGSWIGWSPVMVSQVASRHHSEGANRREGASLRASQRIRTLAYVVHHLSLGAARQVEIAHEHVTWIETTRIVITLGPPRLLPRALAGTWLGGVAGGTGSASQVVRVIVPFAHVRLGLPPVVIVMAVIWRTAAASTTTAGFEPIVRPRIVIARIKIHTADPQLTLADIDVALRYAADALCARRNSVRRPHQERMTLSG